MVVVPVHFLQTVADAVTVEVDVLRAIVVEVAV